MYDMDLEGRFGDGGGQYDLHDNHTFLVNPSICCAPLLPCFCRPHCQPTPCSPALAWGPCTASCSRAFRPSPCGTVSSTPAGVHDPSLAACIPTPHTSDPCLPWALPPNTTTGNAALCALFPQRTAALICPRCSQLLLAYVRCRYVPACPCVAVCASPACGMPCEHSCSAWVITSEQGKRGGRFLALKHTVDHAVAACPCVKKVYRCKGVMLRRRECSPSKPICTLDATSKAPSG